jgi:hypothetical protein
MHDDTQAGMGSQDMDEVTMVRSLLVPPPPPSERITAQARQRLAERAAAGSPRRPAGRRPGRQRRRWSVGLAAAVAASGVAALVVVSPLGGGAHSGHPAQDGLVGTEEQPLGAVSGHPAQAFLLATAIRLAHAPVTAGRYWCNMSVSAQLDPIGPAGQELTPAGQGEPVSPPSDYRYSILDRQAAAACSQPGSPHTGIVGGYVQELGARPATPRDAAAWRRAGSPAWWGWYAKGARIPDRAGLREPSSKPGGPPNPAPPSSPAKLRAYLLARSTGTYIDPSAPQPSGANVQLFMRARTLLLDPLSPAVRAADFQVLASVKGVRMQPGVKDPDGRTGTALWLGSSPSELIIVDPATGILLADEWLTAKRGPVYVPGTVQQYVLWTSMWANHLPG